jgi:hypothetical protein
MGQGWRKIEIFKSESKTGVSQGEREVYMDNQEAPEGQ